MNASTTEPPKEAAERFIHLDNLVDYVWACTFDIWKPDGPLGSYYRTYAIDCDGCLCGSANPGLPQYHVLDEFSGIAMRLKLFGLFDKYAELWYIALNNALLRTEQASKMFEQQITIKEFEALLITPEFLRSMDQSIILMSKTTQETASFADRLRTGFKQGRLGSDRTKRLRKKMYSRRGRLTLCEP